MKHAERDIQKAIVRWIKIKHPGLLVAHIPNSGSYGVKYGAILKAMGLYAGFADLIVIMPGRVGFLEVKAPDGRLSPVQESFRDRVQSMGFSYAVVRSIEDVEQSFREWNVSSR